MQCLDETETLASCIAEATAYLRRRSIDGEVLVADNGSTDGSQEIARDAGPGSWQSPNRATAARCWAGSAPPVVAT